MRNKHIASWMLCSLFIMGCGSKVSDTVVSEKSLKEVVGDKFLMGVALNVRQSSGVDTSAVKIVKQHFNSIVAENCMKCGEIQPKEGEFHFEDADRFVQFGIDNGMTVIGHCLIWHSQLPDWFCIDEKGQNVSPEKLKQRMKTHIQTVVGRYKGKVKGWDVVNEAIVEDGSYRKSKFYEILGEEFIPLAFQYAHEADPDAELYYNDYGMDVQGRREGVVKLVRSLKEKGLRIDAVGMQGHMGMDYPDIQKFEESMLAFASAGVKVMITEWDMSALPTALRSANISDTLAFKKTLNPYPKELSDSVSQAWNKRMQQFFQLFEKHADIVTRVTAWGVTDGNSWKNDFPIRGRRDYPLLFDRNYQPKEFIQKMIDKQSDTTAIAQK
ncbi:endo-1,4-beta-xylanase [Phocaeicola plebeius]|jgi:endo-1,4-beta-xylanase|uniref:Beta-xylanase n=2 Tax=Phocaeicola plebeius TaxID=310297 RepID=A0A3E4ZEG6_9BACT|nr:1,4-beta-xylanase [Phocaeicola plebeius]RHD51653.1 1,4-beta-xylanase [Phocaeicola plebeius]RHH41363.1 1,4-beta-xylanase [Phocaeicola plebeius]